MLHGAEVGDDVSYESDRYKDTLSHAEVGPTVQRDTSRQPANPINVPTRIQQNPVTVSGRATCYSGYDFCLYFICISLYNINANRMEIYCAGYPTLRSDYGPG